MNQYILRVKKNYKNENSPICYIYGLDYYKTYEEEEDEFSKKMNHFYKYGKNQQFFLEKLCDLYNLRFKNDSIKFDYLSLYPTHKKDCVNPNMRKLSLKLCNNIGIEFRQIIRRTKTIKQMHTLRSYEERMKNVKGSIELIENVKDKNILLFDNATITGISLMLANEYLLKHGVRHVACLCLGLGYKEKEQDWKDLNIKMKHSDVVEKIKSPYVPKDKYEKYKSEHSE